MNATEITKAATLNAAKKSEVYKKLADDLHEALKDVIRQIPDDQLHLFNLDPAERISLEFENTLKH